VTRARSVWGSSIERIRAAHTDRVAIVYVRQSSRQQVLEHSESTRLQYGLVGAGRRAGVAAFAGDGD
jgi:hypothetical protein